MPDTFYAIRIKVTGIDKTPALESYVNSKIEMLKKHLGHFSDHSKEIIFECEIGKTTAHHRQGDVYRAEINFTAGGEHLRAEAVRDDLYAAIDKAKDEMERELRRSKNKEIALVKKGGMKLKDILRNFGFGEKQE